jgi:hypothetical protein
VTGSEQVIGLEHRDAWEVALEAVPHAFAHTWDHCHAMATTSGHTTYLYCFRSPEARIVCPVAERPVGQYVDIVTPYGFSGFVGTGDCPSFGSHWTRYAERNGYVCGYLILNPVMANRTYFGGAAQPHKTLFVIDLRPDEDVIFSRLSTNRRRQVRRGESDGVGLVYDRSRLTEFFVDVYPDFATRRVAAGVYRLNEGSMRELCRSPRVLLVGAQRENRLCAVSLFGFTPHAADYLFNASLPGEERHSTLLIWAAIRELKARGVRSLNLGGEVREGDGVGEFKRRFGADTVPLLNVKQVYRPDVYTSLCEQAGVDPADASFFPAYRARARA